MGIAHRTSIKTFLIITIKTGLINHVFDSNGTSTCFILLMIRSSFFAKQKYLARVLADSTKGLPL